MSAARDALAKALDKAIGSGRIIEEPLVYLSTGYPPLDFAISGKFDGGFPAGKIYEISGPSSSGKTALATKLMVEAQKAGGYAIFCDWERSFSADLGVQFGLNIEPGYFRYYRPATWEEGNTKAIQIAKLIRDTKAIAPDAPIVVVLDSIAAAMPQSQLYDKDGKERDIDSYTMNDTTALARVTSTTLKAIKQLAERYKVTMIYLNQIRTKPGVTHGDPTTTPGGSAMEFYADARVRVNRAQIKNKDKDFIGQQIVAKAIKSKFTAPFKKCELRLMFNGEAAFFDTTTSLIEHLLEHKLLPKDGNYILWDGVKLYTNALAIKIDAEKGGIDRLIALLQPLIPEPATVKEAMTEAEAA